MAIAVFVVLPMPAQAQGTFTRYLAEGATSNLFDTQIALLNPGQAPATANLTFLRDGLPPVTYTVSIQGRARRTVRVKDVPGMTEAAFSTVVTSDQPLVVDRTMTWDSSGYGSHAETAVEAPSPIWYLAEGATHSGFNLFYLLQNPGDTAVTVRVRYLRTAGGPLEKLYTLAPRSRTNIWVNEEDFPGLGKALAAAECSAVIEALDNTPIIVERAMYRSNHGRLFNAGHASMGVRSPATRWFLAEGATGPYFDQFVLIANPGDTDAQVTVTYLLDDGRTYARSLVAPANARSGIWVDVEQIPGIPGYPLADVALSTAVESTNGVPLIVERAMWWPGNGDSWHEAHNSAGATETGIRWALAEGEVGGARGVDTYVLIANTSDYAGSATVTLLFEDGTSAVRTYSLSSRSRTNAAIGPDFGSAAQGRRFGVLVESMGATPAQIVVERAMYSDSPGTPWAAGTNAVATNLDSWTLSTAPSFQVNPSAWSPPAAGGALAVQVTSSAPSASWTASSDQAWLTLDRAFGTGDATVTLTAAANPTTATRTATAILAGMAVAVAQAAGTATFQVDPLTWAAPAVGGQYGILVTSSLPGATWSASSNQPWLTLNKTTGTGTDIVAMTASANPTTSPRSATATIAGYAVAVTQAAAVATFQVTPTAWAAPASGGSQLVTVTSSVAGAAWTASSSQSWLTVSATSGAGSATVTLTAQANSTTSTRSAVATIAGVQVTVTQPGLPTFMVTPDTWAVPAAGGALTVTVTSSQPGATWTASSPEAWVWLSASGGAGSSTITLYAAPNPYTTIRTASVVIAGRIVVVGQLGAVSQTVTYHVWGGAGYTQYLGSFSCVFCNEYTSNSINNLYGTYGSEFSSTSIRNGFSQYGSPFSSYSACNQFASSPPRVYDVTGNIFYGELTLNQFRFDAIRTAAIVDWLEQDVCQ